MNLLHHITHECERALHRSRFWCVDTKILVRLLLQYRTTFVPNFQPDPQSVPYILTAKENLDPQVQDLQYHTKGDT